MLPTIFGIFLFIVLVTIINPNIVCRMFDVAWLILTCCADILTNTVGLVFDVCGGIRSRCQTVRQGWRLWKKGDLTLTSIREYFWVRARLRAMHLFDIGLRTRPLHYELEYYHGHKQYKIVFSKRRGARPIVQASTSDDVDITKEIHECLGPANNFHSIPTTPKMLGYPSAEVDHIKMRYKDGSVKTFQEDDIISLT